MAATGPEPRARSPRAALPDPLSSHDLDLRLDEEIGRAERHGTMLSCLVVLIENLDELVAEHGEQIGEQMLTFIAATLGRELRRFDRLGIPGDGALAIVLPGADSPRGEVVARRVLERVHTIKLESQGTRRPLALSVGLAAWRQDMTPQELVARARDAAARRNGEETLAASGPAAPDPPAVRPDPPEASGGGSVFGRTTRS
jgi:diguanylate cyclase (GGDEF)-like protein